MQLRFKLEKETKARCATKRSMTKARVIEQTWAKIGGLYICESTFERGTAFPQTLRVTISFD